MTAIIGFIVQVAFFVTVSSLTGRMRMAASIRGETIEIRFPAWALVVYRLMLFLFSAFVVVLLVVATMALFRGLWGVALFFAILGATFAGISLWGLRDCRRKITIDESGISEQIGKRLVAIGWAEVSVSTWKRLTGPSITDGKDREIVIPSNAAGLDVVEEVILRHVPVARIAFSKGADGQRHIFL
ncbi:MAG: hypothetical protein K1X67_09445 [Fimbriimonadaceae bacterium]|nr:hypothetical protein [Fimbriimonadaceae bacterium]